MRIKLLYGKRGRAIDLTDYDVDMSVPDGERGFVFGKMLMTTAVKPKKRSASGSSNERRGPSFDRVGRLINEGYYDVGNKAIADELEPLIKAFAASC